MSRITRSIRQEVAFVLRVFDDCTLNPINSGLQFWVDDKRSMPLCKQDGIYVFKNIEKDVFELRVTKPTYFDYVVPIQKETLNPLQELLSIRLVPTPQYAFKSGTALVRFKVAPEPAENPHWEIRGHIADASYYHGRLIKEAAKNAEVLSSVSVYGAFRAGDAFYMHGEEGDECIVLKKVMDNELVLLEKPICYTYKQGVKLYKAILTQTDSNGNGVMYLDGLHQKKVKLKISIGTQKAFKEVEVEVEEGKAVNLGIINIERRE